MYRKMFATQALFVALLGILVNSTIAITEEQNAEIQSKFLEAGKECNTEHPLKVEEFDKFPDGENAGCFLACIFKKLGIMNDKGALSHTDALEHAKEIFKDEAELKSIEEFLGICSKVNEETVSDGEKGCERAKSVYLCLTENSEKFGFNLNFD